MTHKWLATIACFLEMIPMEKPLKQILKEEADAALIKLNKEREELSVQHEAFKEEDETFQKAEALKDQMRKKLIDLEYMKYKGNFETRDNWYYNKFSFKLIALAKLWTAPSKWTTS